MLPRRSNAPKTGDTKADLSEVETTQRVAASFPVVNADKAVTEVAISDMPKPVEGGAYRKLRMAWSDARHEGARQKRIKDKADAEAAAKK